jgi:hypothetical protein
MTRGLGRPAVQPGRPLRADGADCAGCEWAGHNSVAFTLTRYGGLFEDDTDAAVDRLDQTAGPLSWCAPGAPLAGRMNS